jgi:formamidopyrimidine-DNA glycosylase
MTGARVEAVGRRAKYGLIDTDRGDTLVFHLGMSGSWRIDPEQEGLHDHLVITTDEGRRVILNDPRRFGSLDLIETARIPSAEPFASMGPEPLGDEFDGAHLKRVLARRRAPIKAMLLDQAIVAGLGNIYACEALFRAGIRPDRPAGGLTRPRLDRLASAVKDVLVSAIAVGGSSLRDHVRPDGELGYFSADWQVYGREGKPCLKCRGLVRRETTGGRSTFFCPRCQR